MFSVSEFRSRLAKDGARGNLFEVILTPPAYVGLNVQQFSFMCKSAALPQSNTGVISVPYMGLTAKLGGNRTYDDWSVRVINDETFDLRNAMEIWSSSVASYSGSNSAIRSLGADAGSTSYTSTITVNQLGKEGDIIKVYTLYNAHPHSISDIALSWDENNQIEEFSLTFAYDYFQTPDGIV